MDSGLQSYHYDIGQMDSGLESVRSKFLESVLTVTCTVITRLGRRACSCSLFFKISMFSRNFQTKKIQFSAQLPTEIWSEIFKFFDLTTLARWSATSKTTLVTSVVWRELGFSRSIFFTRFECKFGSSPLFSGVLLDLSHSF
jgi:hypothetical protein